MKVMLEDLGFKVFRQHITENTGLLELTMHPDSKNIFYNYYNFLPNCKFYLNGNSDLFGYFIKNNIKINNLELNCINEISMKNGYQNGFTRLWSLWIDISEEELFYIKLKYC